MTQAEKNKLIKELQEKLAEAEKIEVEQPKRWKPNTFGVTYWFVRNSGEVNGMIWDNSTFDEWCYLTGNCFKTKEEAEEYKKQIEYTARYKNYIEEHSEPIDWNNGRQGKWYAEFGYEENEIEVDGSYYWRRQGTICASSEEIIWDAIKEIGEDNFKKYVLGVK